MRIFATIFASVLLTATVLVGSFYLHFRIFPTNFILVAILVIGLHLAGLLIIYFIHKQGSIPIIVYVTMFVLLIYGPCFFTLDVSVLSKPMSKAKWIRYISTLSVSYIIFCFTVVASYRYYFIKKKTDS